MLPIHLSHYLNQCWLLTIEPLCTNFSEILIKIQMVSFITMFLKISCAKWLPFCPRGDELKWSARLQESPWWRLQMETFSALMAICAGNSPVTGEFPVQRPVTRSFDVFFDLRPNKRLSKQSWGWWFETPLRPLWRNCNNASALLCSNGV